MKGKTVIASAIALCIALGVFIFLWNNRDEVKIRRTLTTLGKYVAKPRGESPAAGALKGAGLDRFFAAKVYFSSDVPRIQREITPAEMKPLFIQSRNRCDTIGVDWEILELNISGPRAVIQCTLAVTGSGRGEAEKFTGLRNGTLELEKSDGKWKIIRCELTAPLNH